LVTISAISGGLLIPVLSFNVIFATSESEGSEGIGGDGGSDGAEETNLSLNLNLSQV
jgi:hypothetical protein